MPVDYCLGKDIHFAVLTHAKEILAMAKTIQQQRDLNGLKKIEDSVLLLSFLTQLNKFATLVPHRMSYPDRNAAEAKRPKRVEMPPKEY